MTASCMENVLYETYDVRMATPKAQSDDVRSVRHGLGQVRLAWGLLLFRFFYLTSKTNSTKKFESFPKCTLKFYIYLPTNAS